MTSLIMWKGKHINSYKNSKIGNRNVQKRAPTTPIIIKMRTRRFMKNIINCVENYGAGVNNYGTGRHVQEGSVCNTTLHHSLVHILYILHTHWYTYYKYYTSTDTTYTASLVHILYILQILHQYRYYRYYR